MPGVFILRQLTVYLCFMTTALRDTLFDIVRDKTNCHGNHATPTTKDNSKVGLITGLRTWASSLSASSTKVLGQLTYRA